MESEVKKNRLIRKKEICFYHKYNVNINKYNESNREPSR